MTLRRRSPAVRLLTTLVVAGVFAVGALLLPGTRHRSTVAGTVPRRAPTTTVPTTVPPTTVPPTTTAPDPGSLPQTHALPSAGDAAFEARVAGLWQAVTTGDPSTAQQFFFPLSAYVQVKAESNPTGDWHDRLVAHFDADIATLHDRLGTFAATARFESISVPESAAVWVLPGTEYNKGSYYRVYGTVVHYLVDGEPGSFPIMSMISWRGEWYVVHLLSFA